MKTKDVSVLQTADNLGISRATLYRRLQKAKQTHQHKVDKPKGRPRKISQAIEKEILRHIRKHPFLTIKELMIEFGIHQRVNRLTVSRILHRFGYHSRRPSRKPYLSKRHRIQRSKFVRRYRKMDWKEVVFSDEKRFGLRTDAPPRVWRLQGQRHTPENTTYTEVCRGNHNGLGSDKIGWTIMGLPLL